MLTFCQSPLTIPHYQEDGINESEKSVSDRILNLVQDALAEFDKPDYRLSNIIRKSIRVARLRNDWKNLWWLENEMVTLSIEDKYPHSFIKEIALHLSKSEIGKISNEIVSQYMTERKTTVVDDRGILDSGQIESSSVPEIEDKIQTLSEAVQSIQTPKGLAPRDLYFEDISNSNFKEKLRLSASFAKQLLGRIAHRVHDFLSITEKELFFGQVNANIFEKYRQYVDEKLKQIAPEAFEQFVSAYRRLQEGDIEPRSKALVSCRRILKTLADKLYPPQDKPMVCADGKDRVLDEEKYINRLW